MGGLMCHSYILLTILAAKTQIRVIKIFSQLLQNVMIKSIKSSLNIKLSPSTRN